MIARPEPVPSGVATPAPFASCEAHVEALADVVILRVASVVIERWLAGWHEPTPHSARLARILADRGLPLDPARWRREAAIRAALVARRVASEPTLLATACARWGLDELDGDCIAALLTFELSPLGAALMRHVAALDAGDADETIPLQIAGLAAGMASASPVVAIDRLTHRLAPLALAHVTDQRGAATQWHARADPRWLALVAGRCSLDRDPTLRLVPGEPHPDAAQLTAAIARRRAGTPLVAVDATAGAVAAALALHDRPAIAADRAASPAVIAREARLLDAGVLVDPAMPIASLAALVAQPITVVILGAAPAGIACTQLALPGAHGTV